MQHSSTEQTRQSSRSASPPKKVATTLLEYVLPSTSLTPSAPPEPVEDTPQIDEETLIAERRRRREAILARYQGHVSPAITNLKSDSVEASPAAQSSSAKADSQVVSRDMTPEFDNDSDAKTFEFTHTTRLGVEE